MERKQNESRGADRPWLEQRPCGMRCLRKAGATLSQEWDGWLAFENNPEPRGVRARLTRGA